MCARYVGRGNVIDEATILHALDARWISHAILDVFPVEPLPATSPLWGHPQVTITPHVSAISFARDIAQVFQENLERYLAKKTLKYQVDVENQY